MVGMQAGSYLSRLIDLLVQNIYSKYDLKIWRLACKRKHAVPRLHPTADQPNLSHYSHLQHFSQKLVFTRFFLLMLSHSMSVSAESKYKC